MCIISDLNIDSSKFCPENISEATHQANAAIKALMSQGPAWYEVGAVEYRRLHIEGKVALPPPVLLPNATHASLPSRDPARAIPIRVYKPDNGQPSKGVFLHLHGGGFVLGSEKSSDKQLQMFANGTQLTAISVGYRHAPEDPYPAALHDSIDAAEYLVDHPSEYGNVHFIGGESAGGNLSVIVALHLLQSRPSFSLSGVLAVYGIYDWTLGLPTALDSADSLILNRSGLEAFSHAYLAGLSMEERRNPSISPLYTDLRSLAAGAANGLPPVLFIVGTADCLLDDTILMSTKWSIAGGECIVKIYPGAPHAFTVVPGLPVAEEANALKIRWLNEKMGEIA
ncbi:alpha/beta hydrolase [Aspergillus undulatus]|uniref:alpha/beta hydrolase n=1 Tax=Aspergillus undulatus TaxID=1810928 RepID=UPI003CCDF8F7